ncbi:unnamed protein product [Nippostrongylus brasiliensis]|uniref:Transposase n=1 Tax=Nippostrongylus brasiliensis TaxID=27835 RepID=A0A0N4XRM3_NIPBR|nr:unnamed protein product [Nippostrongylus brasiliensis]VDL87204.1 unnamed protein product [Nippostrongylus brasiliensis]
MMGFSISPNDTRWITNDIIVYMVKAEQRGKSTRPPTLVRRSARFRGAYSRLKAYYEMRHKYGYTIRSE